MSTSFLDGLFKIYYLVDAYMLNKTVAMNV